MARQKKRGAEWMPVRWTEPAVRDLAGIRYYVSEHDGDAVARRIAPKIPDSLDSLPEFHRKGRPGRDSGTHQRLTVYRIHEDRIVIVRILHGAQRFPRSIACDETCRNPKNVLRPGLTGDKIACPTWRQCRNQAHGNTQWPGGSPAAGPKPCPTADAKSSRRAKKGVDSSTE